jgi:hypothetical protein
MMRDRQIIQGALLCEFPLERHVPADHILPRPLRPLKWYAGTLGSISTGRSGGRFGLLIRLLIVGYCCGIRLSEACARKSM